MSVSTYAQTLMLYRQIIKAARSFPSIKRASLEKEIKQSFRANRNMVEGDEKYNIAISVAIKGLQQLQQFTNLRKDATSWSIHSDSNPMPDNRKKS
jgi:hypothetical protein